VCLCVCLFVSVCQCIFMLFVRMFVCKGKRLSICIAHRRERHRPAWPAVPPLMRSHHGPGTTGHTGHCPQPAHTCLGSDPTAGQTAPVRSLCLCVCMFVSLCLSVCLSVSVCLLVSCVCLYLCLYVCTDTAVKDDPGQSKVEFIH